MRRRFLLPLATALLLPAALAGQAVHGVLVERGTDRPVAAATVLLTGADGVWRDAAITDAHGRFTLRAPEPGHYTLRAERVGFRSTTSPPLALQAGPAVEYRLESDPVSVSLAELSVRAGRRCRPRPGSGPETALLWEEARKALTAVNVAEEQRLHRFEVELFAREIEARTGLVRHQERRRLGGQARRPFSGRSAAQLSAGGYVAPDGDSLVFYAPDAHVLLSDTFLADHCFRLELHPERPDLVGLAFEPVPSRRKPEVAGVLWLDRASAELRLLEYRYVNVDAPIADAGAGGYLEFARLPTGRWIVTRWRIRMPVPGPGSVRVSPPPPRPVGDGVYRGEATRRVEPIPRRPPGDEAPRRIREVGGEVITSSVRVHTGGP